MSPAFSIRPRGCPFCFRCLSRLSHSGLAYPSAESLSADCVTPLCCGYSLGGLPAGPPGDVVEYLLVRVHGERRCLLRVERAEPDKVLPGLFEAHISRDEIND